mmetsp:Transcript_4246/g.5593  ORF Transcript_4246/g.5593 Transcript_4246/m.5593 type:complete len:316 (+) Transcript_4246:159-1106(+)|eukprot:CAMPEP_0198147784 /NCGR_PEP_ID=MMETSP1443-20131203/37724_1 /TAXON_ID=186043 /ORGANISM="Entomoneis sp., Strain CCMP2396" /LENGTH=315 /DNA_ID=CAMNT_0043812255 /DNA_START=98 /DNA_END=1045 /DNA_ORIENTATION=+
MRLALIWLVSLQSVSGFRRFGIFSAAAFKPDAIVRSKKGAESTNERPDEHFNEKQENSWIDGMEFEESNSEDDQYQEQIVTTDQLEKDFEESHHALNLLDPLQLNPLLQIPLSLSLNDISDSSKTPVRSFCDTAAMRTVMSYEMAKKLGVVCHLDRRYAGQAIGVGSCRVLGRIPAGVFDVHLYGMVTVPSPAITILEESTSEGVELLLGLDFLRDHQAIVDLRLEELRLLVDNYEYSIPFLRPRGAAFTSLSGGSCDILNAYNRLPHSKRHHGDDERWSGSVDLSHDESLQSEYEYCNDGDDDDDGGFIDMSGV